MSVFPATVLATTNCGIISIHRNEKECNMSRNESSLSNLSNVSKESYDSNTNTNTNTVSPGFGINETITYFANTMNYKHLTNSNTIYTIVSQPYYLKHDINEYKKDDKYFQYEFTFYINCNKFDFVNINIKLKLPGEKPFKNAYCSSTGSAPIVRNIDCHIPLQNLIGRNYYNLTDEEKSLYFYYSNIPEELNLYSIGVFQIWSYAINTTLFSSIEDNLYKNCCMYVLYNFFKK